MKKNLVKKQVIKAQNNKHRKAKQVQLQDFQHKERKLNIIGALVWRRDSEIQVIWMIISGNCNLK
jgi:hypothetical protein